MPDGPRERFEPKVELAPVSDPEVGFIASNASGLTAAELLALNRALQRLIGAGLTEREAKLKLYKAVAHWLEPTDAADARLEVIGRLDRLRTRPQPGRAVI